MRKTFFTVAKASRPDDPVMKTLSVSGGTQAKIIRRNVYEKALLAANNKFKEGRLESPPSQS